MPQSIGTILLGPRSAVAGSQNNTVNSPILQQGSKDRIAIIDTLRGFAVLGILLVNIN